MAVYLLKQAPELKCMLMPFYWASCSAQRSIFGARVNSPGCSKFNLFRLYCFTSLTLCSHFLDFFLQCFYSFLIKLDLFSLCYNN